MRHGVFRYTITSQGPDQKPIIGLGQFPSVASNLG
jgi:hypothetical protein